MNYILVMSHYKLSVILTWFSFEKDQMQHEVFKSRSFMIFLKKLLNFIPLPRYESYFLKISCVTNICHYCPWQHTVPSNS